MKEGENRHNKFHDGNRIKIHIIISDSQWESIFFLQPSSIEYFTHTNTRADAISWHHLIIFTHIEIVIVALFSFFPIPELFSFPWTCLCMCVWSLFVSIAVIFCFHLKCAKWTLQIHSFMVTFWNNSWHMHIWWAKFVFSGFVEHFDWFSLNSTYKITY